MFAGQNSEQTIKQKAQDMKTLKTLKTSKTNSINKGFAFTLLTILSLSLLAFPSQKSDSGSTFPTNESINKLGIEKMPNHDSRHGIEGHAAPELTKDIHWVDGNGDEQSPVQLADYEGKFKVLYGFQSWCPGCHSRGLPALQKMTEALKDNDQVVFFALQTVFEGAHVNTKEKMLETQQKYRLKIPFGHDAGNAESRYRSTTMNNYRTGGTPWFIFIDQENKVIFNDFHLDVEKAIEFLQSIQ